jgi:hypothetical protein
MDIINRLVKNLVEIADTLATQLVAILITINSCAHYVFSNISHTQITIIPTHMHLNTLTLLRPRPAQSTAHPLNHTMPIINNHTQE